VDSVVRKSGLKGNGEKGELGEIESMSKKKKLTQAQCKARARRLKLVLTDNDGVLTDTGVYYSETGESLKRFSIRDGMGVELLRRAGVETAIITSETSPSVQRRAEKLKMPFLYLGVKNKREHLEIILRDTNLTVDQIAYIGDDVNDLDIIAEINRHGLTACPGDAMPVVQKVVHYRCRNKGGRGAFRDLAEWILQLRNASNTDWKG
jgi:3-deoxy-D-manno-octulosonate 8-phosphate phosphatase (KDO 8-P phosphatase)